MFRHPLLRSRFRLIFPRPFLRHLFHSRYRQESPHRNRQEQWKTAPSGFQVAKRRGSVGRQAPFPKTTAPAPKFLFRSRFRVLRYLRFALIRPRADLALELRQSERQVLADDLTRKAE